MAGPKARTKEESCVWPLTANLKFVESPNTDHYLWIIDARSSLKNITLYDLSTMANELPLLHQTDQ